jgi:hypothetical protein
MLRKGSDRNAARIGDPGRVKSPTEFGRMTEAPAMTFRSAEENVCSCCGLKEFPSFLMDCAG